jgi:hypothetical protein
MPHTLTEVGEIGISTEGRNVVLRPSFASIASLGSPREIVDLYADLHVEGDSKRIRRNRFWAALELIMACATEDITDLVGYRSERLNYVPGKVPMDNIVILARSLAKHGIVGDVPPPERTEDSNYTQEFVARDFVAVAQAHLGASESEAWNMTMTGFILALRAKYPPPEAAGSKAPTIAQHDETMSWLERVNKARGG